MNKNIRQYIGILVAIVIYYLIHEGAHFVMALYFNVFKNINFLGLGIQIDVFVDKMSDIQMGIFCLSGALATLLVGIILILLINKICSINNKLIKSIFYYVTMIMMFLDPIYLSILCDLFGGGDMNGIELLIPKTFARLMFGIILIIFIIIYIKYVLPKYTDSFNLDKTE